MREYFVRVGLAFFVRILFITPVGYADLRIYLSEMWS